MGWLKSVGVVLLGLLIAVISTSNARADTDSACLDAAGPSEPMSRIAQKHFESSYLAHPFGIAGLDSISLEASLAPHFYVRQAGWRVAFVLTPKIVVRMFNEASAPTKTPSYMPRMTLYAWWNDCLQRGQYTAYGSLSLSHHSNGQSDPFLLDNGAINHDTGNFSTNYLELAAHLVRDQQTWFGWSRFALIWHLPFNQEHGLRGRYGLRRLLLTLKVLETSEPLDGNLTIEVGAILDHMMQVSNTPFTRALERIPISVKYTVGWPSVDLGFYAGYYLGHDSYNIWFDRWIHTIQLGISGRVGPT